MAWGEKTPEEEKEKKWSMNSLDHLISLRLSEERTRTSSEINDLKNQIRNLERENKRLLSDQSIMSSEWNKQAAKLSGALESQANYSKQVYNKLDEVLKRESEAKKIINKNFKAMEEYLNEISKTTLEEVSKRLQEAFEQFSSDQQEQDSIINGHSDDLNMLKDKLKLASDMSDATTPEWVNAIDELTSQFSSALTDLEKRFNEDSNELNMKLDSLQTLLKGELPLQPRA